MDDRRIGRAIRALRYRRRWRQSDLAAASGTSQPHVSRLEAGRIDEVAVGTLRRVLVALDASLVLSAAYQGGGLDRLLDQRHATLVESTVRLLRRLGWEIEVEASYSRYGERGSIDVLALRPATSTALMIEVKSELVAIEGTLRPMDAKARLVPSIVIDRLGWRPTLVGRLLVLPNTSTARRRVERYADTLDAALPVRGPAATRWLRQPVGSFAGLVFLSSIQGADGRRNPSLPKRVRRPLVTTDEREIRPAAAGDTRQARLRSAGRMGDGNSGPSGG